MCDVVTSTEGVLYLELLEIVIPDLYCRGNAIQ